MTMPFNPMAPDPRMLMTLGMPSAPQAAKKPSLWEQMQQAVAPAPTEYGNMVGEKDVKSARNAGLLQAGLAMLQASGPSTQRTSFAQIAGQGLGAGVQGYQGAIDRNVQGQAQKQGMDFNRMKMDAFKSEQAKMAQLSAGRQAIVAKYGQPDPKDPAGMAKWIDSALPDLIAAGDEDMVGRLSEIRKSLGSQQGKAYEQVHLGNKVQLRDPVTHQVVEELPMGATPRDSGAGAEQRAGLQFQRDFQRTNQLADDYRNETKELAKASNQYRTVTQVAPAARQGDPASQISLIFAYMKTLDPSSVVREGEYATAQNAAGVPEKVRNQWNKVLSGGFLTPEQVDHFAGAAKSGAKGWKRQQENFQRTYRQRAERWHIQPDDVTIDYFDGLDMTDPPPLSQILGGKK